MFKWHYLFPSSLNLDLGNEMKVRASVHTTGHPTKNQMALNLKRIQRLASKKKIACVAGGISVGVLF